MYQLIEKGIRGEISFIAQRHSNANNNYVKSHDKNKASKFIV